MYRDRKQMEQYNQDNRSRPGLVGYAMRKLDTKSAV